METTGGRPVLGKISIVIGDDEEVLDLDKIVPIEADLSEEFARQPSLYAYVAMLAAQAESLYRAAQQGAERTKARADKAERDEAKLYDAKITETMISNRVMMREDVQEAEEQEAGFRYQYLLLKAIVSSMDQRAQMLISLGAHLRAEAEQTGMLIRDTKAAIDNLKSRPRL